jgi:outer membrane protein OmpA-like peptidoglycan-associated protein
MMNLMATMAVAALSTAPQQSPDCRMVSVYFESDSGDLTRAAVQLVDTVYALVGSTDGSRVTATIAGHVDSDEQARGLTSLDEQRVAAVWSRLQALRTGRSDQWAFTVRSMNDTQPAHPNSGREALNRRAELSICPTGS